MRFQHEHIAEICDRRKIADHPRKANLSAATIINPKAQRMLDGPRHHLPRNALRPIAIGQEIVDDMKIESSGIGADPEFTAPELGITRGNCRVSPLHEAIVRWHLAVST